MLGFVIADLLFRDFPDFDEGQKSKVKARLVSTTTLARQAERLALGDQLLLGRGEEKTGGRRKQALLADAYEALIAAVYLDGGVRFTARLNGRAPFDYAMEPSEYVRSHLRIAAFANERPDLLSPHAGDVFMACSDWPHSEGTAHPLEDYRRAAGERGTPAAAPGLFGANLGWLLRQ